MTHIICTLASFHHLESAKQVLSAPCLQCEISRFLSFIRIQFYPEWMGRQGEPSVNGNMDIRNPTESYITDRCRWGYTGRKYEVNEPGHLSMHVLNSRTWNVTCHVIHLSWSDTAELGCVFHLHGFRHVIASVEWECKAVSIPFEQRSVSGFRCVLCICIWFFKVSHSTPYRHIDCQMSHWVD